MQAIVSVALLLMMHVASAASFIATVEENNVFFGQSIHLRLQLEDAKARGNLDLTALSKNFNIYSQNQFSSYSNTNGIVKSEFGWQVTLMPKQAGEFVIPPISIETDKGLLKTEAIKVSAMISKNDQGPADAVGISLVSTVNKAKAFINEPIIYTLKIISYKPIANVVLDDIKSNDAIVEKIGEPKQYDQSHGGVRAHIIEIRYAITALKPGKITIAPATMHGELQIPVQQQRTQRYSLFSNIFMDNMFELKPFSLQSETITLDVKPAVGSTNNWLPLNGLLLTQTWDIPNEVKVGETITRKIKMVAKGGFAKQLPSIKNFMPQNEVKVYANKPTFSDTFDAAADTIVGTREEEYSIVPQTEGTITFPEIQIKWWNLRTKKMETTTLPAKLLQVLPAAGNVSNAVTLDYSDNEQPQTIPDLGAQLRTTNSTLWYVVIGALTGIIVTLGVGWFFIYLRSRTPKIKLAKAKDQPEIIVKTVHDLREYILRYAIKYWHVPANVTLNRLGDALANNNYIYNIEIYSLLSQHINAGIYAKVNINLDLLLVQWEEFKNTVTKTKHITATDEAANEDYSSLNPT